MPTCRSRSARRGSAVFYCQGACQPCAPRSLAQSSLSVLPVTPMSHIVILVANRQAGSLTESDAARAKDFCSGQHLSWLAAGQAAEFIVKDIPDIAQLQ